MNREQAVELARKHAAAKPESYYAEPFQPHEWVIEAIIEAARRGAEPLSGDEYERATQYRAQKAARDAEHTLLVATMCKFFERHGLGPKLKPSCLVCGRNDRPIAIQHAELPGIVVCAPCRHFALAERYAK